MLGLMMHRPLLISSLLRHAEQGHAAQEVVSRRVEGDLHRYTIRELAARTRRLANALARHGIGASDRVATLAWNGYRHFELYYAVSGAGAVLHTLNPRLHPDLPAMRSVPLSPETLAAADAVLLVTDHTAVDYELVAREASLIVDTRGVYRRGGPNVVKA